MSSKKPVTRFRQVVEVKKSKNFDPRFKSECGGDFDDIKFQQNFSFLNNLRKTEILVFLKVIKIFCFFRILKKHIKLL